MLTMTIYRRGLKDRGEWELLAKPGRKIAKSKGVVEKVREGVEKVLEAMKDEL